MKVYLVHCEYFDYGERYGGSVILGVYSSMERAISARNDYVESELDECSKMNYPTRLSSDYANNPVIEKLSDGSLSEDCIYTIEEWTVD